MNEQDESYLDSLLQSMTSTEEYVDDASQEVDIPVDFVEPPIEEVPVEIPEEPPIEEVPVEIPEEPPVEEVPVEIPEEPPVEEPPVEIPEEPPVEIPEEPPVEEATDGDISADPDFDVVSLDEEAPEIHSEFPVDIISDENGEDLSELLGMLAEHYEEEQELEEEISRNIDDSVGVGMDDVFQDALSAVGYENDEDEELEKAIMAGLGGEIAEDSQEEVPQEEFPPEEIPMDIPDKIPVDEVPVEVPEEALAEKPIEVPEEASNEEISDIIPEPDTDSDSDDDITDEDLPDSEGYEEKPKKKGLFEKLFGNIINDKVIEEELAEYEAEIAATEEAKVQKEEKKKKAEEDKEEKAAKKAADKEKKDAEKAKKAEEKKRLKEEKAEKKRIEKEREARRVVGKINPIGASIVCIFFAAICVFAILGSRSFSYNTAVKSSEKHYEEGAYTKAYLEIMGLNLAETDQVLFEKIRMCAQIQSELEGSESYIVMGLNLQALDCLIKGVKHYDNNKKNAMKYKIEDKQKALYEDIAKMLKQEFKMTPNQAREISGSESREEYTERLKERIGQGLQP